MSEQKYKTIGIGGSFDHFHLGHQAFIKCAAELADQVLIGVTSQELTAKKPFAHLIEPYEVRLKAVQAFCEQNNISYIATQITDVYGPTLDDTTVDALCATTDTKAGVEMINTIRLKRGLPALPVHFCPLVPAEDGKDIHSTRIRAGEINRTGQVYAALFKTDLKIADPQRQVLSQPQGKVVFPNGTLKITSTKNLRCVVGDNSLETFIVNQWPYDLGIFDKRRQRQEVNSSIIDSLSPVRTVENKPGYITVQLIKSLNSALASHSKHLFVDGEEDLAAVALILLVPLQTVIYYGQPNQGIVKMVVNEELKNNIYELLAP